MYRFAKFGVMLLVLAGLSFSGANASEEDDAVGQGGVPCDPYPIGRCGDFQRESVIFCYVIEDGLYINATAESAVGLIGLKANTGQETGVAPIDEAQYYLRTGPTEDFVNDPFNAPVPLGTLYEETNFVQGLQPEPFWCGKWVWFAECVPQQWMGPTGVVSQPPDQQYV